MRIEKVTIAPAAADDDLVAVSQTPLAAGPLTLTGTELDYARVLVMTTSAADQAKTLVFVGTDADGNSITETVNLPNASTGVTTKLYKTVTSITVSAATIGTVKVGTVGTTLSAVSKTYPQEYLNSTPPTVSVVVSGTINFSVLECFDDILEDGTASATFIAPTALSAKNASTTAPATRGVTGLRVQVNSYSSDATLVVNIVPASNK